MEHGHLHSQLPGRARPGPRPRSHRLSGLYANSSSPRAAHPPPASGPDPFGLVTPERGFLPVADPLRRLRGSAELEAWEEALYEVPKLSVATSGGLLRRKLAALPRFPLQEVLPPSDEGQAPSPQLWRAYSLLSFLSHAYVWCDEGPPPGTLPSTLAVPWARVASALGMPPVLCYCTYNLLNWRRLDAARPIELGNIV